MYFWKQCAHILGGDGGSLGHRSGGRHDECVALEASTTLRGCRIRGSRERENVHFVGETQRIQPRTSGETIFWFAPTPVPCMDDQLLAGRVGIR